MSSWFDYNVSFQQKFAVPQTHYRKSSNEYGAFYSNPETMSLLSTAPSATYLTKISPASSFSGSFGAPPQTSTPVGAYPRANTLLPSPKNAKYKLCVVQFKVPGAKNGGTDKGPDGNRIDSIPIANGVIAAGGACDLILFDSEKNGEDVEEFKALTAGYDALIVRINPGQLSQGTEPGTQERFDSAPPRVP